MPQNLPEQILPEGAQQVTRTALLHNGEGDLGGGVTGGAPALPGPWASPRGALSSMWGGETRLSPGVSALGVPVHPPALQRQQLCVASRVSVSLGDPTGAAGAVPATSRAESIGVCWCFWVLQDQQEGGQEASRGCSPAPGGGCGGAGAAGGCESFVQPSPCTRCFWVSRAP